MLLALLLTLNAHADAAPPELKLPNHGRNCTYQQSFHAEKEATCGQVFFQRWHCPDGDWLLVGRIMSDVSNGCSPTLIVDSAVPENSREP